MEMIQIPKPRRVALSIRVSAMDQISQSQSQALIQWCTRNGISDYEIFCDHGISRAKGGRPGLSRLMQKVEADEISQVVVFSLSRFARSASHLLRALEIFKGKNVRFRSITEDLDTEGPTGSALLTLAGFLLQLEREILRERVVAGLKTAKANGVHIGRARQRNDVLIHQLLEAGMSYREIGKLAKTSHGSVGASKKEWMAKKKAEGVTASQHPDSAS